MVFPVLLIHSCCFSYKNVVHVKYMKNMNRFIKKTRFFLATFSTQLFGFHSGLSAGFQKNIIIFDRKRK